MRLGVLIRDSQAHALTWNPQGMTPKISAMTQASITKTFTAAWWMRYVFLNNVKKKFVAAVL